MLRRKAVALAVAGALGAPVAALAQNVQIYGKLYPQIGTLSGTGGTPAGSTVSGLVKGSTLSDAKIKGRENVDSSNSRLGFRGSEDLGGGLKAIFQIESKVSIDNSSSSRVFATRDSYLGLAGGFGTVKLGNMDTVYKQLGDPVAFLGISSGNFVADSATLSKGPFDNMSFHEREKNSVLYESPEFGGVQLLAGYSIPVNEEKKLPGDNLKRSIQSYGLKYERGPLYLAAAHEIRKDLFGYSASTQAAVANPTNGTTGVHSKDTATRGAVSYQFPTKTKVGLDVAELEWKETGAAAGKFDSYKNRRMAVTVEQGFGNVKVAANYARATEGTCSISGASCSTDGLKANQINVGAMLSLSKRTGVFAIYSRLTNGSSATYNNTQLDNVSPGTDTTQAAVGVTHSF
jgi:predicted porin